jgi:hypothetical protein
MANVTHSSLTGSDLHEPKGVASASAGKVYISLGTGTGHWDHYNNFVNGYIAFDAVGPAETHSVTTSFTVFNPTFSISLNRDWIGESSPNARLKYTGADNTVGNCQITMSVQQASGSSKDLEIIFRKNGSALNGGHAIVTCASGEWRTVTLTDFGTFSTNDYLEVFFKGSAAFTLNIAGANLTVLGIHS